MKYTEYIWDFDGTLFDTYPVMVKAFQRALRELGIEEKPDTLLLFMKKSIAETIDYYQSRYQLEELFFKRYLEIRRSYSLDEQPPYSGAMKVCCQIVQQGGRNFIVSHRESSSLYALLDHYGMRQLFTEIITGDDGFERKPSPEAFLYLIKKNQLKKESTLAIGDRILDIQAGREAGIKTVFINLNDDLDCDLADFKIHSLEEALSL
ncbi:MAG: HAD-IA family hydrolase [Atribacterota bacterium]|uniref:Phosphoglycolate phosphatase n=1 Tax=Atribacter laminatus TaxID=2847778 RepID=A0A7T1AKT8_ATRLM|nr:HAD-IA family hydrolase [Atribacter laminatus]MDI9594579.1 HAD-IA family hydrolase [Atribacterota bacterium]QPM67724.1 Phosphoglycolate phosphatase [Atribacter laminatus]